MPEQNQDVVHPNPVVPIHDSILPYEYDGVLWALVNVGNDTTTENGSMAELFEAVNRSLLSLSNTRDCFVVSPPSVDAVKNHHNAFVRLDRYIDSRTKTDPQSRFDIVHVTPKRRKFTRYPVRYWDVKNRWVRRWIELYLYGLSNMVQMSEANTWTADWTPASATYMKRPFQEAYRIMCIDLFGKPLEDYSDEKNLPLLTVEDFTNYNPSAFIPTYELLEHPYGSFFSDDRIRDISTPSIKPDPGVTTVGGDTISPAERDEQRVRDAQASNPIIP